MMRAFLICLMVIALSALLGLAIAEQAGYVLIAYKGFRYESSLWATLALLVAAWLIYRGLRLAARLLGLSGAVVNPWSRHHRNRRVRLAARRGQIDLAEGQWAQALRHLRRAAAVDPQPLVHYLGAARAASELGDFEQSDQLLQQAQEHEPGARVAVGLTRAQLQIARGQYPEALSTVQELHRLQPRQQYVLQLLQQLYVQLRDWPALCQLLPALRKQRVLDEDQLQQLERGAWAASLQQAGQQGLNQGETALQPLTQQWSQLPAALRQEADLVLPYAEQLRVLGASEQAEDVLRAAIKRHYDPRLVYLYGQVRGRDPARQLQAAEGWLKGRPHDAVLLLSLGRLCLNSQLWGKAREYFEASLSQGPSAEACGELARLLAQLGEMQRSNQLFQEGLQLLNQALPNTPRKAIQPV
ncbi:MAG: heme biosynthesis HemY N-terminal domain-containing protein [Pseudomonas sp.]|uniref:heme biosynthesis HemY N-terminal domain-containing protein n=1 Tax=Pseudomonas sp. TaxID=306 RepID=UPI00339809DD